MRGERGDFGVGGWGGDLVVDRLGLEVDRTVKHRSRLGQVDQLAQQHACANTAVHPGQTPGQTTARGVARAWLLSLHRCTPAQTQHAGSKPAHRAREWVRGCVGACVRACVWVWVWVWVCVGALKVGDGAEEVIRLWV